MWAADAAVLREPDAAVRQELATFDMAGRRLDHTAKLFPLLVGDGGLEVLNLAETLPNKRDQGHLRDSADPGVTDELRIKSQQAFRFFWLVRARGSHYEQATMLLHSGTS